MLSNWSAMDNTTPWTGTENMRFRERLRWLLMRMGCGGKVESDEESKWLIYMADKLSQKIPEGACRTCWLNRILNSIPESVNIT